MGDSHRFSQPPSKVLHIRNLPYETTHEELCELAAPFGEVVQSKLNVGPNRNQAFIEFAEQAPSIQMCNYFNGSAEPAKVRGKTVYLQYSNRNEIVNARNAGETPSNVLLVSLENLLPEVPITLEVLHLVFSAFGFVHKIATFEKSSGLQSLVQFDDVPTAEQVKAALDGRHIPKHLLGDTPYPPLLKIAFSQHTDLNVRVQSARSRDYTLNGQYLPVSGNLNDPIMSAQGAVGISDPTESNVLLAQVENMAYPITVEALHTVFSPYGSVQKIAIFEKGGNHQALVQYPDGTSAANAMAALEGHAIYDGGFNRLKLTYSRHKDLNVRHNNDRSWDYTGAMGAAAPGGLPPAPRGPPAPAAAYAGPGAEQLQGGGGAGLAPHEPGPTGLDYENAHIAVAKGAEAAMRNPPAGVPQYGGQGPHYGAPPGQPSYQAAPQGYAPPPGQQQQYGGGPPPPAYGGPPPRYPPGPPGQPGGPPPPYGPPGGYPGPPGSGPPPPYQQGPPGGPPGPPFRPPSQYGGPPGPPGPPGRY